MRRSSKANGCLSKCGSSVLWTYAARAAGSMEAAESLRADSLLQLVMPPHSLWRVEDVSHTYELKSQLQQGEPQPLFHGPNNSSRHTQLSLFELTKEHGRDERLARRGPFKSFCGGIASSVMHLGELISNTLFLNMSYTFFFSNLSSVLTDPFLSHMINILLTIIDIFTFVSFTLGNHNYPASHMATEFRS